MHGRLHGGNVRFLRVTTDTRALAPGDLFVALKGEQFDGHDFVADGVRARRRRPRWSPPTAPTRCAGELVAVADPLAALGQLASTGARQFAGPGDRRSPAATARRR